MLYPNLSVNPDGHLTIGGHDTTALADQYGTPLMVLDEAVIRGRCRQYREALAAAPFPAGSRPLYASKALCFRQIYPIIQSEGLGADVASCGELHTAFAAGFPMEQVYFHGNNKTDADIAYAMDRGLGYFVCDNQDELLAIEVEAAARGITQKLLLRLTPGIDPHTHEKIRTGQVDSKFGAAIETGQAQSLLALALAQPHVRVAGVHCHIGSQISDAQPFLDAAVCMLEFLAEQKVACGFEAEQLNLGGGMAVPYVESDAQMDYAEVIRRLGLLIRDTCLRLGLRMPLILLEPGRSLVAAAGTTLYTVGSTKKIPGFKNYASIDGGMTDNPRYTLYQAAYTVLPANRMGERADFTCTIAGRCCESGDLIQENVTLPEPKRGDLLAVLTTGAYNYSMASNYNRVPRPAVVLLREGGTRLAVRRESLDDLLRNDM